MPQSQARLEPRWSADPPIVQPHTRQPAFGFDLTSDPVTAAQLRGGRRCRVLVAAKAAVEGTWTG